MDITNIESLEQFQECVKCHFDRVVDLQDQLAEISDYSEKVVTLQEFYEALEELSEYINYGYYQNYLSKVSVSSLLKIIELIKKNLDKEVCGVKNMSQPSLEDLASLPVEYLGKAYWLANARKNTPTCYNFCELTSEEIQGITDSLSSLYENYSQSKEQEIVDIIVGVFSGSSAIEWLKHQRTLDNK